MNMKIFVVKMIPGRYSATQFQPALKWKLISRYFLRKNEKYPNHFRPKITYIFDPINPTPINLLSDAEYLFKTPYEELNNFWIAMTARLSGFLENTNVFPWEESGKSRSRSFPLYVRLFRGRDMIYTAADFILTQCTYNPILHHMSSLTVSPTIRARFPGKFITAIAPEICPISR